MYLDPTVREYLISLGVDGCVPHFTVYRLSASTEGHLRSECLTAGCLEPFSEQVSLLDLNLALHCSSCALVPSWSQVKPALDELHDLQWVVQQVDEAEQMLMENDPETGLLRSFLLGDIVARCRTRLGPDIVSFEGGGIWTFSKRAAPALFSRVERVLGRGVELLRSPIGIRSTWEGLLGEGTPIALPDTSLFVDAAPLSGIHLAAVYAFGAELAPGRFWVRDSALAVGALGRFSTTSLLSAVNVSEELLAAAIVLWEPDGGARLGSAVAALDTARILLSDESSNT